MVPAYRNVGSHGASTRSPSCQEEGVAPVRSGSGAKALSVVSFMVIVSVTKFANGVSWDCRRPGSAVKQNPGRKGTCLSGNPERNRSSLAPSLRGPYHNLRGSEPELAGRCYRDTALAASARVPRLDLPGLLG